MAYQHQLRRGTASQIADFTGAPGEVVVDTTNNQLVVQDGVTEGGWPVSLVAWLQGLPTTNPGTGLGLPWINEGFLCVS